MYRKQSDNFIKHLDFLILDILVLEVAYVLSYIIRHGLQNPYADTAYLLMAIVMMLFQILVVIFYESYKNILQRGYLVELKKVIVQNTILMLLIFSFVFLTKTQMQYSRLVFVQLWGLNIVGMYVSRLIWKRSIRNIISSSEAMPKLLVISDFDTIRQNIVQLKGKKYQSFKMIGAVVYDRMMKGKAVESIPVVADWDEIFEFVRKNIIDEVFISIKESDQVLQLITENFLEMGIVVHINLDWNQNDFPNVMVQNLGNCSVLTTSIKTATNYQLFMKRMMDIVGGFIGVVITGIFTLFVAPIIYIQSPGPVFFSQVRVGKNGRLFKIYKFRSMYPDAEKRKKELMDQNKMDGLMFKMDNDPRIFPVGKILRKFSIDEFPQFWNVLKGDMSLVGTRPPTLDEFEQYESHHKVRLSIKPGITGMWQVSGRSDITDFEEVVRLDNQYISNWNLKLDIKILFMTMTVIFKSRGAV